MSRRSILVSVILLVGWAVVAGWQVAEHLRVREAARVQVINRARDISSTMALVMRSQRRFGVISRERLESALAALIKPDEVNSIALLSSDGEVIAAAGEEIEHFDKGAATGVHWGESAITLVNLVDLGTNVPSASTNAEVAAAPQPTLVIPREQMTNNFPPPPPPDRTGLTNSADTNRFAGRGFFGPRPRGTNNAAGGTNRPSFSRPFWMSEAEYQVAIKKQGIHSLAIVMSAEPIHRAQDHDLWMRAFILLLAGAAAGLAGVAWGNFTKSAELQLRLVRASEMNGHLKQMNLAAAGLAHETRNPLNIIRGLAQMISKQDEAAAEVREKSRAIVEETDRVTAQLNEFINYSRPREVRRTPVPVAHIAAEVARALAYDAEEKHAQIKVSEEAVLIEADEQLLRQTLFNLLLNAVQAVDDGGRIEVAILRGNNGAGVSLEVRDNGPGVSRENRGEIFKPYFTTHQRGTGLGLAVVQQIVSAHGWDIECADNHPRGAIFRINRLKLAGKN